MRFKLYSIFFIYMHLLDNFVFYFYPYSIDQAEMNLFVNPEMHCQRSSAGVLFILRVSKSFNQNESIEKTIPQLHILSFLLLNADF